MLRKISSNYILVHIFCFTNEKQKLELIKYSKSLQNKLEISIFNYKVFSGKYIKEIKNGIVKEYDSYYDTLIFKGKYKNGKRNGKGAELRDSGEIIFEGQYKNGKRNGKGKEYHLNQVYIRKNNPLKFEGEYLNGKMWDGKGYDENKNVLFKIKNGKGIIQEYDYDVLTFEGEYLNGEKNGKGKAYYFSKIVFDGEYLNNKKWTGKGYEPNTKKDYQLTNGKGFVREYDHPLRFEGEYLNGEKNGKGIQYYTHSNRIMFEGEFFNGKRKKGKEYNNISEKLYFEGEYLYGKMWKGKYYLKGILEFEGIFLFDRKWDGKGYDKKGKIIYELKNGNGTVKEYDYRGNLIFKGEYKNGRRWNGIGKEYDCNKLMPESEYVNGIKKEKKRKK